MLDRIAEGRTDLVYDWVEAGGSPTAQTGGTGLANWCAYYGDVSGLKYLLTRGEVLTALGPDLGLRGAAFHGHWRLVEFLLERGADPDAADPETQETPLHLALCKRESYTHEQVVRVLLAFGAAPNAVTRPGVETGCFMRDARTRGETPLHRAAAFGTTAAIKLLLAAGADLQAKDAVGDTPLSWASWALRGTEALRLLCYGPHQVREGRLSMEAYLIGRPLGERAAGPGAA